MEILGQGTDNEAICVSVNNGSEIGGVFVGVEGGEGERLLLLKWR